MATTTTTMITMATTIITAKTERRRRLRIVAAAALIVASACSTPDPAGDGAVATSAVTTVASQPAPSISDPVSSNSTAATAAGEVKAPVDPVAVLAGALGAYSDTYRFAATATVNGETASTVDGRWVDGNAQFVVRSGAGEVEYVVTAEGQWVRTPDGAWQELDGAPPADDPLQLLAAPSGLRVLAAAGADVRIAAVYPGSAFGGEEPVEVTLTFRNGMLAEARYVVEADGNVAESVTVFSAVQDTSPITVPQE